MLRSPFVLDEMPHLRDLDPARAAVLVAATHGALVPVLQQMIDAGLDPYVVYVREPPIYSVVVLALEGDTDTIVQEIELSVDPRTLDEATRMGLIEVWISVELERSRIRSACAALRIKEFQTRPPKFPRPPAKRRSGTQER